MLPTQSTEDYLRKQYFQQVNQVQVTDESHNFFNDHRGHQVFGTTTGYPCCLTNMHQGWPKFVQSLWFATADNGLAALVYGASEVTAKVADGSEVTIDENKLKAEIVEKVADNPWNLENVPITVKTKGKRMPVWTIDRNSAGKIPSPSWPPRPTEGKEEGIILIPYGCSTLRIAEFPVCE